jgi:putative ABC transport system ATP-binding protein
MINGGTGLNHRRTVVRQILKEFEGDVDAATFAMREYMELHPEVLVGSIPSDKKNVTPTTPILLSVQNLVKVYNLGKQKITVLDDISFDIHEAEIIAITGASGSGKTTLMNLLGALDKPTSGDILVGEVSLAKLSDGKLSVFRRQTIGFVFQFFYLQPFLKLKRNLEVSGMFARMKPKERASRVAELAEKVGLSDRLNHYPKELSGGQMQRAAIARALLNNPKLLLADEPTGNLDSKNSEQIIELFESIRREFNTTVVIVTHDRDIAKRADRVISLVDGRIV